jgi:NADP-dependent 3-hydroxy acid dehydrogenase YdfG
VSVHRPRALITGATRGVGAAVARALGDTHDLLLGGRDQQALEQLAGELPTAAPWPIELTDFEAMAEAVSGLERLDVLVHSAGVWEPGSVGDMQPDTWRQVLTVNVLAVAELTRLLLPALRTASGRIVLINSMAGLRVSPRRGAYSASKFALRALGEALRAEEADNGVGVTSIYPGRVATDMQRDVRRDEQGSFDEAEYLTPEAVANAVLAAVQAPSDAELTEVIVTRSGRRSA